nr:hypothetical protein Itr_chr13CG05470 [Ipomoea trifida]
MASRSSSTFWFQVDCTASRSSKASGSFTASRSSPTFWFQVPLGLVLVLRNHETCVSPSRHETCVLPSRLVPRGRPHRLGVVHGLEVGLHPLVPSLTWIIYAHGTCVSPSRLVPQGRPHRLRVVRGLEVALHLLVPSPTWLCFGSPKPRNLCFAFTPASASRSTAPPRGRPRPRGRPPPFGSKSHLALFWFSKNTKLVFCLHT